MNTLDNIRAASECPLLKRLAESCNNGACNVGGLIRSLPAAISELPHAEIQYHPAVKSILGHILFLCGEGIGPSPESYEQCGEWLK